jgi:hypothetical protein
LFFNDAAAMRAIPSPLHVHAMRQRPHGSDNERFKRATSGLLAFALAAAAVGWMSTVHSFAAGIGGVK